MTYLFLALLHVVFFFLITKHNKKVERKKKSLPYEVMTSTAGDRLYYKYSQIGWSGVWALQQLYQLAGIPLSKSVSKHPLHLFPCIETEYSLTILTPLFPYKDAPDSRESGLQLGFKMEGLRMTQWMMHQQMFAFSCQWPKRWNYTRSMSVADVYLAQDFLIFYT